MGTNKTTDGFDILSKEDKQRAGIIELEMSAPEVNAILVILRGVVRESNHGPTAELAASALEHLRDAMRTVAVAGRKMSGTEADEAIERLLGVRR